MIIEEWARSENLTIGKSVRSDPGMWRPENSGIDGDQLLAKKPPDVRGQASSSHNGKGNAPARSYTVPRRRGFQVYGRNRNATLSKWLRSVHVSPVNLITGGDLWRGASATEIPLTRLRQSEIPNVERSHQKGRPTIRFSHVASLNKWGFTVLKRRPLYRPRAVLRTTYESHKGG